MALPAPVRLAVLPLLLLSPLAARAQSAQPVASCTGGFATVSPTERYACNGVDLMARLTRQQLTGGTSSSFSGSELWGWTDPQTSREYALVGVGNGTAFVDVTDPANPVFLGRLPQPAGISNSGWRTLRVYNNHVFIGSEATNHGIQVFDLTRLRAVTSPPVTFTQDARYTGNSNSHTLVINEATGFLYVAGGTRAGSQPACSGLHMVNIQNPLAPTFAGCFSSDGYTHEAQCLVYDGPDTEHVGKEICITYQGTGSTAGRQVSIVDVTNKSAPVIIGAGNYPNDGYSHQGWLTEDRRYLLVNDEFDESPAGTRTIVMEVDDLDDPTFAFNYHAPTTSYAHNLYIVGRYAYLSNYTTGLHILDVSGVASGQLVSMGTFDTYSQNDNRSYNGQWHNYPFFASGTIIANDIQNGLFVLRPTGLIPTAGEAGPGAAGYALSAPAPNPTTGRTRIDLSVSAGQHVRAEAFDALGRRVATVFEGTVTAGAPQALTFDGSALPSGPYLVRVTGESFTTSARVTVAH